MRLQVDVATYESMVEEIELLRDVRTAARQIEAGECLTNEEAKAELRRRLAATDDA
jgi:hypothetical protein